MRNSVLIVGAGKGLSSSLARLFHYRGYRVGLVARNINKISHLSDEINAKGRLIKGSIKYDNKVCTAILNRDIDGRVIHAQCNCSHFRYHKLQQGPCRHIVALSLTSE